MRFHAAQIDAYLTDDLWLRNARQANAMATRLGDGLKAIPGTGLLAVPQANILFCRLPQQVTEGREADELGGEGGEDAGVVGLSGKEQVREDERRGRPVEKEVVPLDSGAHRAGDDGSVAVAARGSRLSGARTHGESLVFGGRAELIGGGCRESALKSGTCQAIERAPVGPVSDRPRRRPACRDDLDLELS